MSNITAIDALNASNVTFTVGQAKAGRNPSIFMKLVSNRISCLHEEW
jgi:hypothetical protein